MVDAEVVEVLKERGHRFTQYEIGKWQRRGLCDEVRTVLNSRLVALKVNGKDVI